MIGIYISFVLAFMLMILSFSFGTLALPGDWYKEKLPLIQLILFALAFFLALFGYFLSGKLSVELANSNSLFQQEFFQFILLLYAILFFGSIYKYYRYRLDVRDGLLATFELSAGEYNVVKEFHLLLDEKIYMPNVKSYAIYKDLKILFSGAVPENGRKLRLYCHKIKDNTYGCYSFIELDKKLSFQSVLSTCLTLCAFLVALSIALLLVHLDIVKTNGGDITDYMGLFGALVTLLLGITSNKIISRVKGIAGKFFFVFSIIMIAVAIVNLFQSAKVLGIF